MGVAVGAVDIEGFLVKRESLLLVRQISVPSQPVAPRQFRRGEWRLVDIEVSVLERTDAQFLAKAGSGFQAPRAGLNRQLHAIQLYIAGPERRSAKYRRHQCATGLN